MSIEQVDASALVALVCVGCGTRNQPGVRFCMTCGMPAPGPDDAPRRAGPIESMSTMADAPRPPVVDPSPDRLAAPIAPARVIEVGARRVPPADGSPASSPAVGAPHAWCPRCHGAYDPGAQFCRFCGLPLAGRAPASPERGHSIVTPPAPPSEVAPVSPPSAVAPSHDARADRASPSGARSRPAFESDATRNLRAPMSVTRGVTGATEVSEPAVDEEAKTSSVVARVVLIRRDGGEGGTHTVGAGGVTDVGRLEGQILFPDDSYVSPRHARIVARGGAFYVLDLESANGVFVRIPFAGRAGQARSSQSERGDRITARGHLSHTVSDASDKELSDQPLADQDLFLVGQQVLRFEVVRQAEEAFGAASENGTLLFGTPAAPRYARLSQRTVEGVVRDVFHLRKADTVIGRESGDIVFTDDPFLSRRHAVVRMQGGEGQRRRFTITDLGSSNGTFLRIRDEVRLRHGDHFRIGQQLLRFDIGASHPGV